MAELLQKQEPVRGPSVIMTRDNAAFAVCHGSSKNQHLTILSLLRNLFI